MSKEKFKPSSLWPPKSMIVHFLRTLVLLFWSLSMDSLDFSQLDSVHTQYSGPDLQTDLSFTGAGMMFTAYLDLADDLWTC